MVKMRSVASLLAFALLGLGQDTLGLADGYLSFATTNWNVKLVKDSQTLASLKPVSDNTFDFSPFDVLSSRAGNGQYHLGDLTLRYQRAGNTTWTNENTATTRAHVTAQTVNGALASSNLAPTLPGLTDLKITRTWSAIGNDLALTFNITNAYTGNVVLGSLGFPIEFNNIFTNRAATAVEANCSLQDPYIGLDAGYVQVTPVDGVGPALVVTPLNEAKFEAWRFLTESTAGPLYYQSQTFEANYEFQVLTEAYAQNEWKAVTPWNVPTSRTLKPGETMTAGLRFSLASSIPDIGTAVVGAGIPYAQSVPGYVLPSDIVSTLTINSTSAVTSTSVTPSGALTITPGAAGTYTVAPASGAYGHTRLTITYQSGKTQTIHYNIVKSAPTVLSDLGTFLTTSQYYTNTSDPFHRAPSVISYDRSVNNYVLQDDRAWIAGLSDEAGAGSFLAATMKQAIQPSANELAKLQAFVNTTMWGYIQVATGSTQYAVRKAIFYYGLAGYPYSSAYNWGGTWTMADSYSTSRAYDYVHVSAAYWAMYRAARAYPTLFPVASQNWQWYLNQAYETVMYATQQTSSGQWEIGYADDGLMGETVWGEILKDLGREGLTNETTLFEARMKARATNWNSLAVPFGSEMAWDSTGQEGVYYWTNYFNFPSSVTKTINSILGFMPTVPHWGWNGNARRYWDFLYGGKLRRVERQIHHYGSGLNSLPLLEYVRATATSPLTAQQSYMLRVAFGGQTGPLSNIDTDGFAAAAFHSWPDTLAWDAYSGDYGPNFSGLTLGSATYVVQEAGKSTATVYGGNLVSATSTVLNVQPRDAARHRIYIGQLGIYIEIDAGAISSAAIDLSGQKVTVQLADSVTTNQAKAKQAVVWITDYRNGGFKVTSGSSSTQRQGSVVTFSGGAASFTVAKS